MISKINNIRSKIRTNRVTELLYLIAVFCYTFLICYSSSEIIELPYYFKLLLYMISFLFGIPKIISQNYTKNELLFSIFILFFTSIYSYTNNSIMLFIIPLLLIGIKNSNTKVIAISIIIICFSFITIHTIAYTIWYYSMNGTLLSYLHFNINEVNDMFCINHNRYGARWVCFLLSLIYIMNRDNKRYLKFIVLLILSIFVYSICQSRACLLIMIGSSFFILFEKIKYFDLLSTILMYISSLSSIAYSFIIQFLSLDNHIVYFLNKLTHNRIRFSIDNRINFGFHLIVKDFNPNGITYYADNLLLDYLTRYGVLYVILLFISIIIVCFKYKNTPFNKYFSSLMFIMALSQRTPRHITLTLIPLLVMHNFFEKEDKYNSYLL